MGERRKPAGNRILKAVSIYVGGGYGAVVRANLNLGPHHSGVKIYF